MLDRRRWRILTAARWLIGLGLGLVAWWLVYGLEMLVWWKFALEVLVGGFLIAVFLAGPNTYSGYVELSDRLKEHESSNQ